MNFTESKLESDFIDRIVERACKNNPEYDRIKMYMDLSACNAQTPLKLDKLLEADEYNFQHDVRGIQTHINRRTGFLEHCFLPRFAY